MLTLTFLIGLVGFLAVLAFGDDRRDSYKVW